MHVRHVTPEDFAALRAFDMSPLPTLRESELALFTQWCGAVSFVASDGADPPAGVALALRSADGTTVYLHALVVRPAARNAGCGSRLLRAVEDAAAAHGARRLALYTARATEFYRVRGYAPAPALVRSAPTPYNQPRRSGGYWVKPLPVVVGGESI